MGSSMVDWDVAVSTARALVPAGPSTTPAEARELAEMLRSMVPRAERVVADFTGLTIPVADVPVAIVDRIGWVEANVDGFQVALAPLLDKITEKKQPSGIVAAVGSRIAGAQLGTLMSYLASRVLGQFELFLPPGEGDDGRLTLVAPNILETERKLDVVPEDFRYWVTIHEVTHRTQFTAVPWLRGYFTDQVQAFLDAADLDPGALFERIRSAVGAAKDAAQGKETPSLIELVQTPAQRAILDRMQALMSLLEGHGDFVMDGVGPTVVPTAAQIRERFEQRRKGAGPVDRFVRKLLGLDLKMRQYAEGEAFVRAVVEAEGMTRFNAVWTSPETLPTLAEIKDPDGWVARVLTDRPAVAGGDGA
jgi:coenzyme F420 biosynthesis associated uncharacterized protein